MTTGTSNKDLDGLTLLGKDGGPSKKLEVFPNHHRDRDYAVTLRTDEFTCLCPMTGQPDFASLTIAYVPDASIVESKSLKLYLWSFRNEGAFHEHVTNTILDDLVKALEPRWCKVSALFAKRGGIAIAVDAEFTKAGFALPQFISSRGTGKEMRRTGYQGAEEKQHHSPSARWDRERDRNRPDWKRDRNEEKRRPYPAEQRTESPPKRSERKTTKSLGVTRTWRKRMQP